MTAGDVVEVGGAEVHSGAAAGLFGIQLGELVLGSGEVDFKSCQLAQPAFTFGFGDAGDEVVENLDQAATLAGAPGGASSSGRRRVRGCTYACEKL